MNQSGCEFCNLVSNLSSVRQKLKIVYETDNVLAFHSLRPISEVHIIVISKRHISSILELNEADNELSLDIMSAMKIAAKEVISLKGACKVIMHLGSFQEAKHLHYHVVYDSKNNP